MIRQHIRETTDHPPQIDIYEFGCSLPNSPFGVPNIDLPWSCGGTVNPSCFAGHQLLVLFLPTDNESRCRVR